MEDHMNTCRLVLTAAFVRGMRNYPVAPPAAPVDKPVTVYHAMPYGLRTPMGQAVEPELYVDVSGVITTKREMLALHRSQKEWLDASQGVDSYLDHLESLNQEMGQMSGQFDYAEGWIRHLHYGYCDEDANPLLENLPPELTFDRAGG